MSNLEIEKIARIDQAGKLIAQIVLENPENTLEQVLCLVTGMAKRELGVDFLERDKEMTAVLNSIKNDDMDDAIGCNGLY